MFTFLYHTKNTFHNYYMNSLNHIEATGDCSVTASISCVRLEVVICIHSIVVLTGFPSK